MALLEDFAHLFHGRTDAWGSVEGKANKEPVTLTHYERHLRGEVSLGIYPLLDNNECHFFAVDIDDKDFSKALKIRSGMAELGVSVYIAESKSKGFHVYGFCSEGVLAKDVRDLFFSLLLKLGLKHEVFPKQDTLDDSMTKFGNYINLPCFGAIGNEETTRNERATGAEKTKDSERAMTFEKTMADERATAREQPISVERATQEKQPIDEERANGVEKTKKGERAIENEKTRQSERANQEEKTRDGERPRGSRLFVTIHQEALSLEVALPLIIPATREAILIAKAAIPLAAPLLIPQKVDKDRAKGKKGLNHPLCIQSILRGVQQGCRDEAAFALARHYLDQLYLPEEVLSLLLQWDQRNKPPIGDARQLQTKIQSAQKGYAFGCSSIKGDDLLSGFCPGESRCDWLQEVIKEKKKKGLLQERSFYETDDYLLEELVDVSNRFEQLNPRFLCFNRKTGEISYTNQFDHNGVTIVPAFGEEAILGAVLFPSGIDPFISLEALVGEIKEHLKRYVDLPLQDLEYCAWYIIMTWCPMQMLFTTPYLRFRGDTGTGKSRCLDAIGRLCYKPLVVSGAITPAPIYRIIKKYGGTVILDEADFSDSSEKSEVITVLNSGFEMGRPILRCQKDEPNLFDTLTSFGPKVLATRFNFRDMALEGRCLTLITEETDRDDIPPILGKRFRLAQIELRKKLLSFRLHSYNSITEDIEVEDLELGAVEPRLKQTGTPLAIALRSNPEALDKFKTWLHARNAELIAERADSLDGRIVLATFMAARSLGQQFVTPKSVQKVLSDDGIEVSDRKVGSVLKSLHVIRKKIRMGDKVVRVILWDTKLFNKLARRYIPDRKEYAELLQPGLKLLELPAEDEKSA